MLNKNRTVVSKRFFYVCQGVLVGIISGLVVAGFRIGITSLLAGWQKLYHLSHLHPSYLLAAFFFLVAIGLLVGKMTASQPHIKGSGIPEVEGEIKGRLKLSAGPILWRKFTGGILVIGSGLYLGREGPCIQLGGAIGKLWGKYFKATASGQRLLLANGASAGLSAAFNAPLAATIFVLEEIYHSFSPNIWLSTLASAISADLTSMALLGFKPVLDLNGLDPLPLAYYGHLIFLGVALGLLGRVYQIVLLAMSKFYHRFFAWFNSAFWLLVPLILLLPLGYFFPQTLGGGNQIILHLGRFSPSLKLLVWLFILRFIFSMLSYGSGACGGIFLPILTLGGIVGLMYGKIATGAGFLPEKYDLDLLAFAMAGYFAGISKAPFTAIILVTEMVGNLEHLVPLALVSLASYLVIDVLDGPPIYDALLSQMHLPATGRILSGKNQHLLLTIKSQSWLVGRQVRDIPWPDSCLLIQIKRKQKNLLPHGDTLLTPGDKLELLVDVSQRSKVKSFLLNTKP